MTNVVGYVLIFVAGTLMSNGIPHLISGVRRGLPGDGAVLREPLWHGARVGETSSPEGEGDRPQGGGGVDHASAEYPASKVGHPSTTCCASGPPPLAAEDEVALDHGDG